MLSLDPTVVDEVGVKCVICKLENGYALAPSLVCCFRIFDEKTRSGGVRIPHIFRLHFLTFIVTRKVRCLFFCISD